MRGVQRKHAGQRDESRPGQDGVGCARFHGDAQNDVQFKTDELFICGNFHFIFSDHI